VEQHRGRPKEPQPEIREMAPSDHAGAHALWRSSEGIGLSAADGPDAVARYLARNPGMSFVACAGEDIVGTVLCGHDGRRGYLHHLAVAPAWRRSGLGRALAERGLEALRREGIDRCHLFVKRGNQPAADFWARTGWFERADLRMFSRDLPLSGTRDTGSSGDG